MARDFNDSYLFTVVVREGSFSGAARMLGLPSSSVSRRLSRLEERVGVRLLQRTTRRSALTDAGRAYFDRVAPALDEICAADSALGDTGGIPRGSVRATVPEDLRGMGGLWASFAAANPEVDLHVSVTNRYVDLVGEGYDVALRAGKPEQGDLVARKVASYVVCLVASPSYLRSAPSVQSRADLGGHAVIFVHVKAAESRWTRPTRKLLGMPVRARLVVEDLTSVREAALSGVGIAALPEHEVRADLESGALREIAGGSMRLEAPLYVVTPGGVWRPRAVQVFVEHLVKQLPGALSARRAR